MATHATDGPRLARLRGRMLGAATRVGVVTRTLPGAAGALLVSFGFGEIYRPLTWIFLGLFALAVDREL